MTAEPTLGFFSQPFTLPLLSSVVSGLRPRLRRYDGREREGMEVVNERLNGWEPE